MVFKKAIERNVEAFREAYQEWARFASLPGTRVVWKRQGKNQYELFANDRCLATVQLDAFYGVVKTLSINVDERRVDYERRRLRRRWQRGGAPELVEVTASRPALIIRGGHGNHRADGTIELPGHGTFGFPVRGTDWVVAVMSAVDESGKSQLQYRIGDSKLAVKTWQRNLDSLEVVIAPECQMAMESVLLLIAVSSSWLRSYFEESGSGAS